MLPEGAWSVTSLWVIAARVVAAPHSRIQLELDGVWPNPWLNTGAVAVGVAVLTGERSRLMVRPEFGFGIDHAPGEGGARPYVRYFVVEREAWAAGLSLIGASCVDRECRAAISLGARNGWTHVDGAGYLESSVFGSGMIGFGAFTAHLEAEVETCHRPAGCYGLAGRYGGGVRRAWRRWVWELGWTKMLDDKDQPSAEAADLTRFGSPWFSVTYYRL